MHPAYSVIVFTVASGAGFGLMAWLALWLLWQPHGTAALFILLGFGTAFVLSVAGLLSSMLHLGRPERAWRAFSQWRTSWLSREGVTAVAALGLAALLALAALFDLPVVLQRLLALPTLVLAVATVWCTGMIYESLTTIRAWNHALTTEIYVVQSLASGAVLLITLLALLGWLAPTAVWIGVALLLIGAVLKLVYWNSIDHAPRSLTAEAATGLGDFGKVRPLLEAHTQANYVMREMGYVVGRRHADKLRLIAIAAGFAIPAVALLLILPAPSLAGVWTVIATLSMALGLLVERWLFFAEAQHVATLYYGASRA